MSFDTPFKFHPKILTSSKVMRFLRKNWKFHFNQAFFTRFMKIRLVCWHFLLNWHLRHLTSSSNSDWRYLNVSRCFVMDLESGHNSRDIDKGVVSIAFHAVQMHYDRMQLLSLKDFEWHFPPILNFCRLNLSLALIL